MATTLESIRGRHRGRARGFLRWWIAGAWWARSSKLLLVAVLLYNLYACAVMRIPPVHGIILDKDTGKPIAGAEIFRVGSSTPFFGLADYPYMGWAPSFTVSDSQGRFFFPAVNGRLGEREAVWLDFLWPFQWIDRVDLAGYHKDYVSFSAYGGGLWHSYCPPAGDDLLPYTSVRRRRIPILGLYYMIHLAQPKTKQEWLAKIYSIPGTGHEDRDASWKFNDLTGYLERWPEGEKAGEYYRLVWGTAAFRSCDYMRQDLANRQLTKDELKLYCERGSRIISIAETFRSPPHGMDMDAFLKDLERHRESVLCARNLLEGINPSQRRGVK
jgi:hypothetical protein